MTGRTMAAAIFVAVALTLLSAADARSQMAEQCARVDIGHAAHYCSAGDGAVTVVLEAGARSTSAVWTRVAAAVAPFARVMRAFAALYPDDVAGILLIDSPHERFDERRDALLSPQERAERAASLAAMRARVPPPVRLEYEGMDATPHSLWRRPLPDVPLIVMSATRHGWQPVRSADAQEVAWQELQRALARLTREGQYRAVPAGHNVHTERPDLVIDAIRELVERN